MKRKDKLDQRVPVPMSAAQVAEIDEWRAQQRPIPTRAEAIRRLVDERLKSQKEPAPPQQKVTGGARTVQEFIRWSGLSRSTVYVLLDKGDIESSKIGGIRMIHNDSYRQLLERTRVPPKTKPEELR
jgi:hypothetical protein